MGRPQSDPTTSVIPVNTTPTSADAPGEQIPLGAARARDQPQHRRERGDAEGEDAIQIVGTWR